MPALECLCCVCPGMLAPEYLCCFVCPGMPALVCLSDVNSLMSSGIQQEPLAVCTFCRFMRTAGSSHSDMAWRTYINVSDKWLSQYRDDGKEREEKASRCLQFLHVQTRCGPRSALHAFVQLFSQLYVYVYIYMCHVTSCQWICMCLCEWMLLLFRCLFFIF